jgi:hypothetical protein
MVSMVNNIREEKGKAIALKSDVMRVSDTLYRVNSQTTKRKYNVWRATIQMNLGNAHVMIINFDILVASTSML